MRCWFARKAAGLAEWCLARSDAWVWRSDVLADASEWLEGRETWAAIRARRKGEG